MFVFFRNPGSTNKTQITDSKMSWLGSVEFPKDRFYKGKMPSYEKSPWLKGNTSSNGGFSFRGVYVLYAVLGSIFQAKFLIVSFRFSQIQCWDSSWFGFASLLTTKKSQGFFRQNTKLCFFEGFPQRIQKNRRWSFTCTRPMPRKIWASCQGVNWKNNGLRPWEEL